MKTAKELAASGLKLTARSENGAFEVASYIRKERGRKIYGYWDYKLGKYVEQTFRDR